MLKTMLWTVTMAAVAGLAAAPAAAGVEVGKAAPAFTLEDEAGTAVSLADFKGKVVVLEWLNPDCPFVQRHYKAGTMKSLATTYGAKGVVWLTVNSTNYMDAAANAKFKQANELPYPILVDQEGTVGHLYGAQTTPHMYVIDADGTLAYMGAIDDDPRGGGEQPQNYVAAALDELLAGKAVTTAETTPYGCSVKYKK
ncbi:MAG: thioredoxin family protein [Thermoanaerobaculales bacterium]|jgi:peroxiredoxin|nr:thioredoxin family protein [Thermoanaerobaculales bacterium]